MRAVGMIEVYSFTMALCVADLMAKTADVSVIAMDRNRPIRTDVPAPLVMVVKVEGSTAAVQAAVAAGKAYAEEEGKYIVSHVIPRPDDQTAAMAYRIDINRDLFNKKITDRLYFLKHKEEMPTLSGAIGIVEVQGLVAAISGLDEMLKAADVRVIHSEKRLGGRLVTFVILGKVASVREAVAAGLPAAEALGTVYGHEVIPNPSREIMKYFDIDA